VTPAEIAQLCRLGCDPELDVFLNWALRLQERSIILIYSRFGRFEMGSGKQNLLLLTSLFCCKFGLGCPRTV